MNTHIYIHLLGGSDGKVSAYNAGDPGSIPGLGRSPGEGNGNPLQYSCPPQKRGLKEIHMNMYVCVCVCIKKIYKINP